MRTVNKVMLLTLVFSFHSYGNFQGALSKSITKNPVSKTWHVKPKKGAISNGVQWQLIEICGEDGTLKNVNHSKATIKFNVAAGKFTGNSSCNSMFGMTLIDGLTIKISEVGSTKMSCTDLISSKIEMLFMGNLQKANNYTVKNNKLTLMLDKTVLAVLKKV